MIKKSKIIKILTIAGSDSSAGAGLQADLKTVLSLGGFCTTAITCVTAQNTKGVLEVLNISEKVVTKQIQAIYEDFGFDAIKIGLIPSVEIAIGIRNYIDNLNLKNIPIVVDPVYVSSSGFKFLKLSEYIRIYEVLSPLATLLTPNILELQILSGNRVLCIEDVFKSIEEILKKNKISIFVKGSHLEGTTIRDILYDKKKIIEYKSRRIKNKNTHGTGCTIASAITFYLAKGYNRNEAIKKSRKYILKILKKKSLGGIDNNGPLSH